MRFISQKFVNHAQALIIAFSVVIKSFIELTLKLLSNEPHRKVRYKF